MELDLKGERALVSGASSGLGSEIATVLAGEGVTVVVHGGDASQGVMQVRCGRSQDAGGF
jgi:3-oxoacyl-[acyl-carrier protein] reductase